MASQAQKLDAILAGMESITSRLDALESQEESGVQVVADKKPKATRRKRQTSKSRKSGKPNRFTAAACERAGWHDVSVGDTVPYENSNGGVSTWTIVECLKDGSVLANRKTAAK